MNTDELSAGVMIRQYFLGKFARWKSKFLCRVYKRAGETGDKGISVLGISAAKKF